MAESIKGLRRTCRCGEVTEAMIGQEVTLMGWVAKCRNKGGIVFIDLRDRSGIMQIIFEGDNERAGALRSEFCIAVTGIVEKRGGAVNTNLKTGTMEVRAESLRVLSEALTPPYPVQDGIDTREDIRLKYRYLDLRRPELQKKIMFRSRLVALVRSFMESEGFLDIETPDLIGSTPEGARDYLVPSRVHPGCFYALPQSPQLFKQLLMCSGFDRYYQIARCFRDEDLRADRQPEFTQIDMELSFVEQEDVMDVNTRLLGYVLNRIPAIYEELGFDKALADAARKAGEEIAAHGIEKMTWKTAMDLYGSDKPDLRFDLPIRDVSETVKDCGFSVFTGRNDIPSAPGQIIVIPELRRIRKFFRFLTDFCCRRHDMDRHARFNRSIQGRIHLISFIVHTNGVQYFFNSLASNEVFGRFPMLPDLDRNCTDDLNGRAILIFSVTCNVIAVSI